MSKRASNRLHHVAGKMRERSNLAEQLGRAKTSKFSRGFCSFSNFYLQPIDAPDNSVSIELLRTVFGVQVHK